VTDTFGVCQYEGEMLKQVRGHFLSKNGVSADKIQNEFAVLEMNLLVFI
jgi:hypothetical protein